LKRQEPSEEIANPLVPSVDVVAVLILDANVRVQHEVGSLACTKAPMRTALKKYDVYVLFVR